MTTDFIQRAMDVFLAAIDLPAAEQRAFVARECGVDERLRVRVEELLRRAAAEEAVAPVTFSNAG